MRVIAEWHKPACPSCLRPVHGRHKRVYCGQRCRRADRRFLRRRGA